MFKEWTCVIVDSGNTDETIQQVKAEVSYDDRFRIFKKANEGPSIGRNFGHQELPTNVEYIHFLDGDDALAPHFLSDIVAYLDSHPEVGLLEGVMNL